MGLKKGKQKYIEYYMSMDLAFCQGPVDGLIQVYINEKKIFEDDEHMFVPGDYSIDKPELYGGDDREGGFIGTMNYSAGTWDQLLPQAMCDRIGGTSDLLFAYRGIMHLMFHGNENSDRPGAVIAMNNPRVPSIWARPRRMSTALQSNHPYIMAAGGVACCNPAEVIYELVTNPIWGMGGDPDMLDVDGFRAVASTLFDEGLGIADLWESQDKIEDYIADILAHIDGLYFFDPFVGKAKLKLVRNDYDPNTLPVYGPDEVKLTKFRRKLWGETVNEITVQYTDGLTEEQSSVTFNDPTNIEMQDGAIVTETRNYHMFRDADQASKAALRELQSSTLPLASVEFFVNRQRWDKLPGDVIKFRWPAYDIETVILRVLDVDWGTPDKSEIKVTLIEDVWGFTLASYVTPPATEWEDPRQEPNAERYDNVAAWFFAPPLSLLQQDFGNEDFDFSSMEPYPQIMVGAVVTPNKDATDDEGNPLPDQADFQNFNLYADGVDTVGNPTWNLIGPKTTTGMATIPLGVEQESFSRVQFTAKHGGDSPEVGRYAIITNKARNREDWRHEFVQFTEKHAANDWTIKRGIFDTVPRRWEVDAEIFFIGESWDGYDMVSALAFNLERYKIQPRTSLGLRDLDLCPVRTTKHPNRPYLPYRPANVKLELTKFKNEWGRFGEDETQGRWGNPPPTTYEPREKWMLTVSWANRNRLLEDSVVRSWDDGTMPPEAGQTTSIIVFGRRTWTTAGGGNPNDGGATINPEEVTNYGEVLRMSNLTGTSHTFDIYEYTRTFEDLAIQVIAVRDGFESLQGIVIDLGLYYKGYGSDWGYAYGGWPQDGALTSIEGSVTLPAFTSGV